MNEVLTNRQISVMLYGIVVGYGAIRLPKDIAEVAGTGGWFSLLIATVINILIVYIITYLQFVFEGKTIYEYSRQLVGKLISYLFIIVYLIYFFIFFTMNIREYSHIVTLTLLNKTPRVFICMVVCIVIAYALMKGINVIARVSEIYVPINILGNILIYSVLITKGKLVNLRPLFTDVNVITNFSETISILPFRGMEILLFMPISKRENKNIFKYTLLMVGFIGILYIYIVESIISVVGVELVVFLEVSMFSVLKGIDVYSLEFARRLDGIYMALWTMNLVCGMCLWGYGIIAIISRIIKNIRYNFMVIIVVFISFILSQIPKTERQVETIIKYNSFLAVTMFLVIPIILFIITKVKKYDKQI